MARTSWSQGTSSIIEGELIALLEVMNEMEHRGITHVIFETDSQSVYAIHNLRDGNTKFNSIICNIKNVLSVFCQNKKECIVCKLQLCGKDY
jgi:ribonuclease HI